MDKKAKTDLAVIYKKNYNSFPEMQEFINRAFAKECYKENIFVDKEFCINNDCEFFLVLCCYTFLRLVMKCIIFLIFYRLKIILTKRKQKKVWKKLRKNYSNLLLMKY